MAHKRVFPDSVESGKPKLGKTPTGWSRRRMRDLVHVVSRPVALGEENTYVLVTAKRGRAGIIARERLKGRQILTKSQFRLEAGDFLISRRQIAHGGCGIVPPGLDGAIVSNEYLTLRAKNGFSLGFLKHLSHSTYFQQTCFHSSIGVHVEKMIFKPDWWLSFKFNVPDHEEQMRIAVTLDTWDTAIDQTTRLIAAKENQKKGLMQQLLTGKRRFSKFGELWQEYRLGDLMEERVERNRSDLPLLAITVDRGVVERDELDKKDTSSADKSYYKRIVPGDIGYNTMRMWQGVSALSKLEGIVSPAYTVCVPGPKLDGEFAAYLFKFPPTVYSFWRYSQGLVSDTLNLKFHNFAQVRVLIPDIDEQQKIAALLATADEELRLLRDELSALKKHKKGLMQQLLTGQIRVKGA